MLCQLNDNVPMNRTLRVLETVSGDKAGLRDDLNIRDNKKNLGLSQ